MVAKIKPECDPLPKSCIQALWKIYWGRGVPIKIGAIDTRFQISDLTVEWTRESESIPEYLTLNAKGKKYMALLKRHRP